MRSFLTCVCLTLAVVAWAPAGAAAETVDEVLARYAEARGGESVASIDTVVATGRALMGDGVEFPFRYEWMRPNRFRFELTVQGVTEIQAFDGETSWTVDPPGQPDPIEMSPQELALLNDAVDFEGPLINAAAKGHTAELVGEEEFEGTPAYKIKLIKADGMVEYCFLETESMMEIAQHEVYDFDGQEVVLQTIWGDYKEFEGVILPTSWSRGPKDGPAQITLLFENMEVNADLADNRFAMPEVKEAAE